MRKQKYEGAPMDEWLPFRDQALVGSFPHPLFKFDFHCKFHYFHFFKTDEYELKITFVRMFFCNQKQIPENLTTSTYYHVFDAFTFVKWKWKIE